MSLQPLPELGPPLLTQYRFCSPWAFQPGVQPQYGVAALAALGTSSSGSLPPPVLTWCIGQCRRCGEETAEGHIYDDVPVRPLCELCVYFQQVLRPPQYHNARDSDTWSMSPCIPRLAEGPQTQTPQTTTVGTQTLSETRTTMGTQTVSVGTQTWSEARMSARKRWKFKPGDWFCEACGNHNFRFREACNNPHCPTIEFKRGDWICSRCHNHNWAKNVVCNTWWCRMIRPPPGLGGPPPPPGLTVRG